MELGKVKSMYDMVVLVNRKDEPIGYMKKMEAHEMGLLHRAFSVMIFDDSNRLLLHQRAKSKYHSAGLWTNTCCSHQRHDEETETAAHRRLLEEMGFDCGLKEVFSFIYRAEVGGQLTEHEYDHVLVGRYDGSVQINPHEVESYKWLAWNEVLQELIDQPQAYTEWFKTIVDKITEIGFDQFVAQAE